MPEHRKLYFCQSIPQSMSGAQCYEEEMLGSMSDETDKADHSACGRRRRRSSTCNNLCGYRNALFYPIPKQNTGTSVTEGSVEV